MVVTFGQRNFRFFLGEVVPIAIYFIQSLFTGPSDFEIVENFGFFFSSHKPRFALQDLNRNVYASICHHTGKDDWTIC